MGKSTADRGPVSPSRGPNDRLLLAVVARGRVKRQGMSEFFFESAEPPFSELSPVIFFQRFPEGIYDIEGLSQDGEELENETELTHTMPAPPVASVNESPMALQCDDEEPGYDATPATEPVVITWEPVVMSHPSLGTSPPVPVSIRNYEVVVEASTEVDGEEFEAIFSAILPSDQTSMEVPTEFLALTDTFKYEVLAREESFNQTAVESCFELVTD